MMCPACRLEHEEPSPDSYSHTSFCATALLGALAAETKRRQAAALRDALDQIATVADVLIHDGDVRGPLSLAGSATKARAALSASPASCGDRLRKLEALAHAVRDEHNGCHSCDTIQIVRPSYTPRQMVCIALDALGRKPDA